MKIKKSKDERNISLSFACLVEEASEIVPSIASRMYLSITYALPHLLSFPSPSLSLIVVVSSL